MRFTFRDPETGLLKSVMDPRLTPLANDPVTPGPHASAADDVRELPSSDPTVPLQYLDLLPGSKPLSSPQ
ncbi:MAG: hypothetical protein GEEBNDBF_00032 [bacterium]|nr:hypothetical protein [bacterium]